MKQKLIIAWKMRAFVNSSLNPKNKKMFRKCYRAYVMECILYGKDSFKVKFGSEYYDSFYLRFKDWLEYANNKFLVVPLYRFIPKKYRPSIINYYIEHGVSKPIHIKQHIFVNESMLECFLTKNDFKIVDEYLGSLETIYYVKRR